MCLLLLGCQCFQTLSAKTTRRQGNEYMHVNKCLYTRLRSPLFPTHTAADSLMYRENLTSVIYSSHLVKRSIPFIKDY